MKKIKLLGKLGQGLFALVDNDDFDRLNQFKWYNDGRGYAVRRIYIGNGESRGLGMHREIMGSPSGFEVDHKNMKKLDNRKSNLRICTKNQNQHNRPKLSNNTSGYKGVSWEKRSKKWQVHIKHNGKQYNLGLFKTRHRAAHCYQEAAQKFHKEFARTEVC